MLRRLLAIFYLRALLLYLLALLHLRLRLMNCLRPLHPDTRLLLSNARLRYWRRSRSLRTNPGWTLKTRRRRRCFTLFRLDALRPHYLSFRSYSGRLSYSRALRLLLSLKLVALDTSRLNFLLSLLLLKLLHLPPRVSIPAS